MANVKKQNTIFVDVTGNATTVLRIKLVGVILIATGANADLTLRNKDGSGVIQWRQSVPTNGDCKYVDLFDARPNFEDGIHATITNGEAVLITTTDAGSR